MASILWLDRDPNRAALAYRRFSQTQQESTIWCRQVAEAREVLQEYDISEVHLGHRLSEEPVFGACTNCTMQLVNWLSKHATPKFRAVLFTVHTHNLRAGVRLVRKLRAAGYRVRYRPFGEKEVEII